MDIAVDYACNLTCEHCSATLMKRKGATPLSIAEYAELSEKFRRDGCLVFHFTGGEPLLRNDLEDIIKAFKPDRSMISIQTNGLLVTRERLLSLKKAGVDTICVSIDSGIPEEHEAFRGKKGLFVKAVQAVEMAKQLGFRTSISTCITHSNLRSEGLKKILEMSERYDIFCNFNLAVPAGNWRENEGMLLTPEDRIEMERMMIENPRCRTDFDSNFFRRGCSATKEKVYLTAYGEVMPCPFIQISLGDVRKEDIGKIRRRAMQLDEFQAYHQICLAAEDRDFISRCSCYSGNSERLPVPYEEVDWMLKKMGPPE